MAAPRSMTAQTLNALKGWPQQAAVDFHAELDATVTDRVPVGAVLHVSSTGTFKLGVGSTNRMPIFGFNASDDPDVINEAPDAATEAGAYVPINPTGQMMGLVAVGAYELVSTHYLASDAANFVPNALLSSDDTGGDAGKLEIGVLGTDVICGVVSRGVVNNGYGTNAVAFWPVFFPVYP